MIPDDEIDLFLDAAEYAVEAADTGRLSEGHIRLAAGMERAMVHVRSGKPWGHELAARYHFALQRYSESYSALRYWMPPVESSEE